MRAAKTHIGVFLTVFVSTVLLMLVYRTVLIPAVEPSAADGLLPSDPALYHKLAVELLERMRVDGWSAWSLRPEGQAPVGVLALVYLLTGPDSRAIILLNSALHAVGTTALFAIAARHVPPKLALLISLPYWLSPYQMSWFSQPNKDSFAAAGALVLIAGATLLPQAYGRREAWARWWTALVLIFFGAALMAIVRPYLLKIALVSLVGVATWFVLRLVRTWRRADWSAPKQLATLTLVWLAIVPLSRPDQPTAAERYASYATMTYTGKEADWDRSEWLPKRADYTLYGVVVASRRTFRPLETDPNQASREALVDLDREFRRASDVVAYLPRALQIGLFAPFPDQWSLFGYPSRSVFRNFMTWQMALAYVSYVLLVWACIKGPKRGELAIAVWISLLFIVAYTLAVPHIGALDRYRYPFLNVLIVLGLSTATQAWLSRTARGAQA